MEVSRGASEKIAKILEDPKRLATVLDALPLPGLPARIDKGKTIVQNLAYATDSCTYTVLTSRAHRDGNRCAATARARHITVLHPVLRHSPFELSTPMEHLNLPSHKYWSSIFHPIGWYFYCGHTILDFRIGTLSPNDDPEAEQ
ncbi:hypothetical protein C8J57DRAFT_1543403 [Mycena rebaudengoi]|nr:hypothetical protein C8J57DRAFT_1543403 [Mycena rebaudengoi]